MIFRQMTVIVNPNGGRRHGLRILESVKPVFADANVQLDIHVTQRPGHAFEIAHHVDSEFCSGICVIGGDGTLHEVVNGIMAREKPLTVPLGVIPAGTGNNIAEHLQCGEPRNAAQKLIHGAPSPLDVIQVSLSDQTIYCVDLIGWGAVSEINSNAERWRWMGPSRYSAATLRQILCPRRLRARLTIDGKTFDDEYLFVIACNPRFAGPGMMLAPDAEIDDGKADVLIVRQATRRDMLRMFSRVFDGTHVTLPFVEYRKIQTFSMESAGTDVLDLDGEMKGQTPFSATVLPGALSILT